jgi:hypothetical protein
MARYLLTRSEGTIGELAHLLLMAAAVVAESGEEAINHRTLSMADYTGPASGGGNSSGTDVKPAPRWPLHPVPGRRSLVFVAQPRGPLLSHGGVRAAGARSWSRQVDDLDTAPPLALAMLSQRSGIEPDRLRCMSFAGWVPWLLDSLDDQIPDALETYAFQLSCCRNSAVGRDPSRAGVPGCPASRYIAPVRSV